jgi:hypothetical protein
MWTLAYFPSLQRKIGTKGVLRLCSAGWPVLFVTFPLLNELLRRDWIPVFWASIIIPIIVGGGIAMSFGKS